MTSDQGGNYANQLSKHASQHVRDGFDPLQAFYDEYDALIHTGRAASDFTKNNNTTLGDVTGLYFAAAANTTYAFTFYVWYTSGATPDFKFSITIPAAASGVCSYNYLFAGTPTWTELDLGGTGVADGGFGNQLLAIHGVVVIGANAGNVQFQAAQNTADVSDTIVKAGSSVVAVKTS